MFLFVINEFNYLNSINSFSRSDGVLDCHSLLRSRAGLRKSISKNTLDDDVLRTSTLQQSNVEKEVFSPVDKADDGQNSAVC